MRTARLVFILAFVAIAFAPPARAQGIYDPASWVVWKNAPSSYLDTWQMPSQMETTSQSVTGTDGQVVLHYEDTGHPFVAVGFPWNGAKEIYQFKAQARNGGTVSFSWHTVIFAAWFMATGDVYAKNFTTGDAEQISWPDWDRSGTASVEVNTGDFWGIEVQTNNYDSTTGIYGTITLSNIVEPRPAGFYWQGAWDPGASYIRDDVVGHGGSSYIAIASVSAGEEPGLSVSWELVAQAGATGAQGLQGPQGEPGPQGPGWPVGSIIMMEPGATPPEGFVLIGTFRQVMPAGDGPAVATMIVLYRKVQ